MTDSKAPDVDALARAETEAAVEAAATAPTETGDVPTSAEYTVAFSPRNVAVGLAIVAGLVALVIRRRRRSSGGDD